MMWKSQESRDQTGLSTLKQLSNFLDLKTSIGHKIKEQYDKLHFPGDNSLPTRFCGPPKYT